MGETMIQSQPIEWTINVTEGMEVHSIKDKFYQRVVQRIFEAFQGWKRSMLSVSRRIWKLGADDPRRVIHSIKVGLALSLVSLFYFLRPVFDSVGGNAIWAVMTVVVVFEFTVGATLSKGINRTFATLLAGFLGVGVSYVAALTGKNCERVILGVSVFALGAGSTYSRFFPRIKQRYDYGVVVFILTFNLVAISGYRAENLLKMACQRMLTIVMGSALCFLINVTVFPVWAGDDLQKSILRNMEGLAESLEDCVTKYFVEPKDGQESENGGASEAYKCVLNSKVTHELLANFATWEPPHGRFFFRYPWNLYVKVGGMSRYCAYCVEALNGLLNSEIQAPFAVRQNLKAPCMEIGKESAAILREVADSIRTMKQSTNAHLMMGRLTTVVQNLKISMRCQPELFIDTKRWRIVEKKPLKTPPNSPEGLIRSDKVHASSKPKPTEQTDEVINTMSLPTTPKEEIKEDMSRVRSGNACEMREMKQDSYAFMEVLPLVSFSSVLIEIVARLESVIMVAEELGAVAKFKNTDQQVKESLPSTPSTPTTRSLTSTKEIVPVALSISLPSATTLPITISTTH